MANQGNIQPATPGKLYEFLIESGLQHSLSCNDGAIIRPVKYPVAAVEAEGAILFADLPGFSKLSESLAPTESACYASHFFAWFEGEAGRKYGGIVDKFIGDEVMMVFPDTRCNGNGLRSSLMAARDMLSHDPYAFQPKMGIAAGPFVVALVGTESNTAATAIGSTVNLAARCVQETKWPRTLKVATADLNLISKIFPDQVNDWGVSGPERFEPHNMAPTEIITIRRKPGWIPNFDFLQDIREKVARARRAGAVVTAHPSPLSYRASDKDRRA